MNNACSSACAKDPNVIEFCTYGFHKSLIKTNFPIKMALVTTRSHMSDCRCIVGNTSVIENKKNRTLCLKLLSNVHKKPMLLE